jgi:hypothetical protein
VAEQLGDDDEVGAAADEARRERVAQDVGGDVLIEPSRVGDGGDDVVRALDGQPAAALVEKQGGAVGAGPVGAFGQPAREGGAQLGVDRDLADLLGRSGRLRGMVSRQSLRTVVGGGDQSPLGPAAA